MKLTPENIDKIIEDLDECIYDDLWNEIDEDYIRDFIENSEELQCDDEDVKTILKSALEIQKEIQDEALGDEKSTLYQELDDYIDGMDIHLSLDDIGKVLVKLAYSYFEE